MPKLLGGPYDGAEVDWKEACCCTYSGKQILAIYRLAEDGNYHYDRSFHEDDVSVGDITGDKP